MFHSVAVVDQLNDPAAVRIRIVRTGDSGYPTATLKWDGAAGSTRPRVVGLTDEQVMQEPDHDDYLFLEPQDARALYEGLAEAYGHTVGDYRTLRRDFEHERARVDRLLENLIGRVVRITNTPKATLGPPR